jgi:DNA polymerase-3 subunit delta
MTTVHTFDYLDAGDKYPAAAVCVVYGDEPFLKRLVLKQLSGSVLGDETGVPFASFEGRSVELRDVLDELATVALFGGGARRLAVVEQADDFVTKHRAKLEDYVQRPRSSGVLILEVDSWQSNTRLYKQVDKTGLQIECRPPEKLRGRSKVLDESRLCKWLAQWSKSQHDATLQSQAAQLLLELVGPQFGLLDQDLAKLALFAGPGGKITPEMVRDIVGGWRTKTTWELLDAACDGDAAEALRQLDRLLQSGEHPVALFGQISWSLRRFAAATRIIEQAERQRRRIGLRDALEQAGFRKWPPGAMNNAERQLKQLGRQRAAQFYRWLLDADLALKGSHSADHRARFVLEQLFLRMSKPLAARGK